MLDFYNELLLVIMDISVVSSLKIIYESREKFLQLF